MDIIIGLLIAGVFVIIVIALILTGGEKSRDKSDKGLGSFERHEGISESNPSDKGVVSVELHSGKISEPEAPYSTTPRPPIYDTDWWKKLSRQQREQEKWRCQACNLSLHRHKYYLHTHHIWGTRYNEPKDLRVLCIGCHSEQPGDNHYRLKGTLDYRGFIKRYGRKWRRANGAYLKRG